MSLLVKICGLTSAEAVDAAVLAGADAVGLVLSPSPRRVGGALARRLFERIPPTVERIAVVSRPGPGELRELRRLPFDGVQVEAGACAELPVDDHAFVLPSFRDGPDVEARILRFRRNRSPRRASSPLRWVGGRGWEAGRTLAGAFVLDGPGGGGRGIPVDPARARRVAGLGCLVLAGGLSPQNVGRAIAAVHPFAVDVSSGVEVAPGEKDPELVARFVAAVRAHRPTPVEEDGS